MKKENNQPAGTLPLPTTMRQFAGKAERISPPTPVAARELPGGGYPGSGPTTTTAERKVFMTDKTKAPASEIFDQALKNYEQALRTGLKVQEEAGKCWTKMLNQAASPQDLHKQMSALANDMIPATQKSMESCLNLLEQNSRTSVDLMKKGLETMQATSPAESQSKLMEFWESSLKTLKSNAQAIVDINSRAMDSWVGLVKKATADVVELKAEKA